MLTAADRLTDALLLLPSTVPLCPQGSSALLVRQGHGMASDSALGSGAKGCVGDEAAGSAYRRPAATAAQNTAASKVHHPRNTIFMPATPQAKATTEA